MRDLLSPGGCASVFVYAGGGVRQREGVGNSWRTVKMGMYTLSIDFRSAGVRERHSYYREQAYNLGDGTGEGM